MKTIKTIALAILITVSGQVFANNKPSDNLKPITEQIENLLEDSDLKIYKDIVVVVVFKIDRNNKITVVSENSNNYRISKFIKSRLNLEKLSVDKTNNYKFYSVPVKFLSNVD